jgi:two-component system response regulator MprA
MDVLTNFRDVSSRDIRRIGRRFAPSVRAAMNIIPFPRARARARHLVDDPISAQRSCAKCHVLIVEDDPQVRTLWAAVLEGEGHRVSTASNGEMALDRLRSELRPDVILLDLMMPEMDGWTFRAKQEADPALASIPVVLVSAVSDLALDAVSLNAHAFFSKPIDIEALLETLSDVG